MGNPKKAFLCFTNSWRQGNTYRLEHLATGTSACRTNHKTAAIVFNNDILQGFEVPFDIRPFKLMPTRLEATIKFFAQDQRQETAKHMASDRFIPFMEDRSSVQYRLDVAEHLFDLPKLFVFECNLFGVRGIPLKVILPGSATYPDWARPH
jgi:hypothetical protein